MKNAPNSVPPGERGTELACFCNSFHTLIVVFILFCGHLWINHVILLTDSLNVSRTGRHVFLYLPTSLCLSVSISCKVSLCDGGLIYQESGQGAEGGQVWGLVGGRLNLLANILVPIGNAEALKRVWTCRAALCGDQGEPILFHDVQQFCISVFF